MEQSKSGEHLAACDLILVANHSKNNIHLPSAVTENHFLQPVKTIVSENGNSFHVAQIKPIHLSFQDLQMSRRFNCCGCIRMESRLSQFQAKVLLKFGTLNHFRSFIDSKLKLSVFKQLLLEKQPFTSEQSMAP